MTAKAPPVEALPITPEESNRNALSTLRQAIDAGFKDAARLEQDKD